MQVHVHDNLAPANTRRERFIRERIDECLNRYAQRVHQISVSLSEIGHHRGDTPEVCCRISVSAGSLGAIAVASESDVTHQAITSAFRQLTRAIEKKVGKRRRKRHVKVDVPELVAVE